MTFQKFSFLVNPLECKAANNRVKDYYGTCRANYLNTVPSFGARYSHCFFRRQVYFRYNVYICMYIYKYFVIPWG